MDGLMLLVCLYIAGGTTLFMCTNCMLMDGDDAFKLLPQDIKKRSKMNWFGCILGSLVWFLISPVLYLIVNLVRFIYWVCHI